MENPNFRNHQRTLVCARLFGELYCAAAIPSSVIFEELLLVLNFGHDVPEALREASEQHVMFAPHKTDISQTLLEDEELDDDDEE